MKQQDCRKLHVQRKLCFRKNWQGDRYGTERRADPCSPLRILRMAQLLQRIKQRTQQTEFGCKQTVFFSWTWAMNEITTDTVYDHGCSHRTLRRHSNRIMFDVQVSSSRRPRASIAQVVMFMASTGKRRGGSRAKIDQLHGNRRPSRSHSAPLRALYAGISALEQAK